MNRILIILTSLEQKSAKCNFCGSLFYSKTYATSQSLHECAKPRRVGQFPTKEQRLNLENQNNAKDDQLIVQLKATDVQLKVQLKEKNDQLKLQDDQLKAQVDPANQIKVKDDQLKRKEDRLRPLPTVCSYHHRDELTCLARKDQARRGI